MKKKLLLIFSLCISGICFSQEKISDISLFYDINQSFENEYYPGTIEKADYMQLQYPNSVFTQPALFIKAKSLIKLSHYEEAIITLENVIAQMHTGKEGFAQCHYLLGIANYYSGHYEKALESFHLACQLSLINDEPEFYNQSIFYSAESFYILHEYEKSMPLYEYVISHGKEYKKADYDTALKKLMKSYNLSGLYLKTTDLFSAMFFTKNKQFSDNLNLFDKETTTLLMMYGAEAYEKLEEYETAYELYSVIVKNGDENLILKSLQNAYRLSESNKINADMGELFEEISDNINNKNIVEDFWIRLGIDEYNNKNYEKAETFFSNVTSQYNKDIINIYRAKIVLDIDSTQEGGKKAETILSKIESAGCITENETCNYGNFTDTYYSLLLQSKIQQDKWDSVPELFGKIKNPDSKSIYINSAYYYKNGEYNKVAPETGVLYGSALCKNEQYEEACKVFQELGRRNQLKIENLGDYSKALFATGQYEKSYNIIMESNDVHKEYIAGLCKINMGQLEEGKNHINNYIRQMSNNDDFNVISLYFKGYIEYLLEDYKNAYNTFVRFALEAGNMYIPYLRNSSYYAAMAAVQNKDFDNAAAQASVFVNLSKNEEEKIKAVVFNFDILVDGEKYDEAVELMKPYTEEETDFTPEALFRIAEVYGKQGKTSLADSTYKNIYTNYGESHLAEESMYKCGEVYYFSGDYLTAYNRFNDYIYKYVDGEFLDSALYLSGDCALRLGEYARAIMINRNMLAKFPDSIYSYGAGKNLLTAYYNQEDFTNALNIANELMVKYKDRAAADNIGTKIIELERITGGTDFRIAEKLSEYEEAGGSSSPEGRKIGAEIVKLYGENNSTKKTAFEFAEKILENELEQSEYLYGAETAEFAGDYCRNNMENKKAADYYLTAAQYYRSCQNTIKAAAVLYSAAEAFVAAGLKGDGIEVANLLKELYPETNYAALVDKIVR